MKRLAAIKETARVALVRLGACSAICGLVTGGVHASVVESLDGASSGATRREQVYDTQLGWIDESAAHITSEERLRITPVIGVTLSAAGIREVMVRLVKSTGLAFSIEGSEQDYGKVSAPNINGSLGDVLDELADTLGFFYRLQGDTVYITRERRVTIELLSEADDRFVGGLMDKLHRAGARDVQYQPNRRAIEMRATRQVGERIDAIVKQVSQPGQVDRLEDGAASEITATSSLQLLTDSGGVAASEAKVLGTANDGNDGQVRRPHRLPASAGVTTTQPTSPNRWSAASGSDIRTVLEEWAKSVGWQVEWDGSIPPSAAVKTETVWRGSFLDAVQALFETVPGDWPAVAVMYTDDQVVTVKPKRQRSGWSVSADAAHAGSVWSVARNQTLRSVLDQWTSALSWSLVWNANAVDTRMPAEATFRGDIADAIRSLDRLVRESMNVMITIEPHGRAIHVSAAAAKGVSGAAINKNP